MKLIPVKSDEGMVSINVKIDGPVNWNYNYYEDVNFHNDSLLNHGKAHVLGFPYDLMKSKHKWDFMLINPTDKDVDVDVEVTWDQIQKDKSVTVSSWTVKDFHIPAHHHQDFSGEAFLVKS